MERGYKITRDDPMPKPDALLDYLKQFSLVSFQDKGQYGGNRGMYTAEFSIDSRVTGISTEMRSNGLLYNVKNTSVICTRESSASDEAQWKRFFIMTLTTFSKYPEIEIEKIGLSTYDSTEEHLRNEKRKNYFKSTFWKSGEWEMPEELKPLYKQFRDWANSVRIRIKKQDFEADVESAKRSLKKICNNFSREELIQIVDESLAERILGA